ncbi:hypothetical protein H6P81_004434 [Aristolochia fimbriata]|uniref:X8 domain-containing protein n=1 Tax=Aristolochia fimbriata TaxID=158543 RepID=A0AAV7FHP1_ARIFI|nr:hypothetical protein H6P81_004434 [Aristolochia fimbriata]
MARLSVDSVFLALGIVFFFAVSSVAGAGLVQTETEQTVAGGNTWCIAKPPTSDAKLEDNINFSCTESGMNCDPIHMGGDCYEPYTLVSHASVAMNIYYKCHQQQPNACFFNGTGIIVQDDPSYGTCRFL